MSHFIYRWHKCLILCIGGTNVAFLAIGGTNVVSYYRWHKCLGGSGTNFVVALFTVGKKSRHHLDHHSSLRTINVFAFLQHVVKLFLFKTTMKFVMVVLRKN
jgi:hypothetical protein